MKIAYLIEWDISQENGVSKKIIAQVNQWLHLGHEVRLFVLSPSNQVWKGFSNLPIVVQKSPRVRTKLTASFRLIDQILNFQPDVVYIRFCLYYPAFEKLFARFPVILEINSNDLIEYKTSFPINVYQYHLLTRGRLLNKSAACIAVTSELCHQIVPKRKPTLIVSNGISLEDFPAFSPAKNCSPRCVFLGSSDQPWQGFDQIARMANLFPDWKFDIIGNSSTPTIDSIAKNLTYHGVLDQKSYLMILAQSDIAIGTLALYRKGMDEACPIKVREYLAYGLPTIIGYHDTDFPSGAPFLLELPNRADNIQQNIEKIAKFAMEWKGKRVQRQWISHLDLQEKETQRVSFFNNIVLDFYAQE